MTFFVTILRRLNCLRIFVSDPNLVNTHNYVNADHDYAMNPGGAWKGDACREPSPLVELSAGLL